MGLNIKIISDAQKGKAFAQAKIYDLYAGAMLGICVRYVKNIPDAEDVLQDAFIKVFSYISKYKFETVPSFSAWMKRVVVNTALNYIRANKKNQIFDEWNENAVYDKELEKKEENISFSQQDMLRMIQNLPDGYRTVFNLYVFEKYTHQDIAVELSISVSTSKTQLFKARRMLQNQINKKDQKKEFKVRYLKDINS